MARRTCLRRLVPGAACASSAFDAYFWEVPPVNSATFAQTPYEHTLVSRTGGARAADSSDFAQHLEGACSRNERCAAFPNLGRDAMLVAPCDEGGPPQSSRGAHGTFYERSLARRGQRAPTAIPRRLRAARRKHGPRPSGRGSDRPTSRSWPRRTGPSG